MLVSSFNKEESILIVGIYYTVDLYGLTFGINDHNTVFIEVCGLVNRCVSFVVTNYYLIVKTGYASTVLTEEVILSTIVVEGVLNHYTVFIKAV